MRYNFFFLLVTILFFSLNTKSFGQDERQNNGNLVAAHFQFGGNLSAGDLKDRFGSALSLGTGVDYMLEKGNWIVGLKGDYVFGNDVKENVFSNIAPQGFIFGSAGTDADIQLKQRGFYIGGHVGKLFSLSANQRSGIRVTLGAGFLQHKIRVQQDATNFAPQIRGEYVKGYDRLSNGLALRQFFGYQYLGNDQFVNFTIGIEIIEGFTASRRSFNFNQMGANNDKRLDMLIGLKLGWTLPFYIGESTGEIFY